MHGEDDLKLLKHNNPKVKHKILLPEIMSLNSFLYDLAKKGLSLKLQGIRNIRKQTQYLNIVNDKFVLFQPE